jgi:hypothetical protein
MNERAARSVDLALAVGGAAVIAWGVLALGWSPFFVMVLFWFENVVIGAANVVRMLATGAVLGVVGLAGGIALAAFFTVHYGMFTAIHGLFVALLFGGAELGREATAGGLFGPLAAMLRHLAGSREGWLAVLAIVLLHASGTVQWLARTRAGPLPLKDLMGAPYGRIAILHVTLIASAFLVQALGAPLLGALLLVGLKLAHDLVTLGRAPRERGDEDGKDSAAQVKPRRLLAIVRRPADEGP